MSKDGHSYKKIVFKVKIRPISSAQDQFLM